MKQLITDEEKELVAELNDKIYPIFKDFLKNEAVAMEHILYSVKEVTKELSEQMIEEALKNGTE